jgi:hypothetical protein
VKLVASRKLGPWNANMQFNDNCSPKVNFSFHISPERTFLKVAAGRKATRKLGECFWLTADKIQTVGFTNWILAIYRFPVIQTCLRAGMATLARVLAYASLLTAALPLGEESHIAVHS